ncbi:hypothetical protein GpartN1_g3973.t1 [Galdieria partita]|uniref:Protein root UVB sensitive/RUS domain-containing protein n=1 Tax=Galdieria partita TaxID=83374 RepID=A0A9C7PYF7_9RHOD|nr:hypothetical protein GpartN1_g3973.t1 [Galdieria partita]
MTRNSTLIEYNIRDSTGTKRKVKLYTKDRKDSFFSYSLLQVIVKLSLFLKRNFQSIRVSVLGNVLRRLFLPSGYPDSVTEDYANFERWDALQGLCSYLRQVMVTRSTLSGLGVGNNFAHPTAAALMLLWREGFGVVGGLLFTWGKSSRFDKDSKSWRLFADVINNVALTMEWTAPLFPTSVFFALHSSANIFHSLCGIAGGATSTAFQAHFAKRNNIADICSKHGNIGRAVSLVGLLLSTLCFWSSSWLENSLPFSFGVFCFLTVFHIYFNVLALRSLHLACLNKERGYIIAEHYIRHKQLLDVASVSTKERFWRPLLNSRMRVGCSLLDAPVLVQEALINREYETGISGEFLIQKLFKGRISIVEHRRKRQYKMYIHEQAIAKEIWIGFVVMTAMSKGQRNYILDQLYSITLQLTELGWQIDDELDLGDEGWRICDSKVKDL